jgi:hypothetical protein
MLGHEYSNCANYYFQMKRLYSEKEMLMASNKSLADYNISQEPLLQQKRQVSIKLFDL